MGNKFEVQVNESQEELKHRLHHAVTASSKERLQMLYWLKQNAIATRKELSQKLGRDESTIYRWLKRYRQGGLTNLLDVKTPPGKKSKISEREMNQLKERLSQPQGFKSYGQIQDWLNQEFGINLAYKSVHKIVRYKLKAKLKTPRPQSQKTKLEFTYFYSYEYRSNRGDRYLCPALWFDFPQVRKKRHYSTDGLRGLWFIN